MPRRPRMYLAGFPYHVVQRGNNREACFFYEEDYRVYLDLLQQALVKSEVKLHAYVLMTNHVHLLMTPSSQAGISTLTRSIGSRYAQYMNKTYGRTGTLWEGRHKSSVVSTQEYLLRCYRYIEMNPVTANMVSKPAQYPWSSYEVNALGVGSEFVTPHAEYLNLGGERVARCHRYRKLFPKALAEGELHLIRKASHYCSPLGDDRFRAQIEKKMGCKLGRDQRGRPSKAGASE